MVKHLVAVVFLLQGSFILAGQGFSDLNGRHTTCELFSERDTASSIYQKIEQVDRRNYVGAGLLDPLLYRNLRFIYERRFGPGSFALYVPLTIGLNGGTDLTSYFRERNIIFKTGAGINFYVPRPRGPSWLILGTGIFGGKYHYSEYEFWNDNWTHEPKTFLMLNTSLFIHIHPISTVILAPGVDVGLVGYNYINYRDNSPRFSIFLASSLHIDLFINFR